MPMRIECKNYESRTYPSGDTVRMCRLDLAPEAPWRCPENCPSYERKLGDGGWTVGSLQVTPVPKEPVSVADGSAAEVLDQAEHIVNAVGDRISAEVVKERRAAAATQGPRKTWWKFWSR